MRTAAVIGLLLLGVLAGLRWWSGELRGDAVAPAPIPQAGAGVQTVLSGSGVVPEHALPPQARTVLHAVRSGGPFPYRQDGQTFHNRERCLPLRARGWYREYTVPTPGARDRGARRIVAGGDPPGEFWYTDDHYRSFRRIAAGPQAP